MLSFAASISFSGSILTTGPNVLFRYLRSFSPHFSDQQTDRALTSILPLVSEDQGLIRGRSMDTKERVNVLVGSIQLGGQILLLLHPI
jgi:hypothetical protein